MKESKNLPITPPTVLIDARMVSPIQHGIGRYVSELAKGLVALKTKKTLSYEPVFLLHPQSDATPFKNFKTHLCSAPFLSLRELFEIPKILRTIQASIYHSPSFSSLLSCPCPSLVTLHDLNHLTYGTQMKKLYYRLILRRFALNSEKIVTVSQFSQNEISNWLKIPRERIEVAFNAIDPSLFNQSQPVDSAQILQKFRLKSGEYFFSLSHFKPHKNLSLLIRAYEDYQKVNPAAWPLALTTADPCSTDGVQCLGALNETEALTLLSYCGGLFFPSSYEGFGLPPVEGAVLGVPLFISNIPPHREGLQELDASEVHWISPTDTLGWTQAFSQCQSGRFLRPSLASRKKTLDRFSAQNLAETMDRIYNETLSRNSIQLNSGANCGKKL